MAKKHRNVYLFLLPALLIFVCLIAFVATRPAPLSTIESRLVGGWKTVPSEPFEQEMVFYENRTSDVDMGTARVRPVRWKLEGDRLMLNEGPGWEQVCTLVFEGDQLVFATKIRRVFERNSE